MLLHETLTNQIIGAAIEVHRELGPGLLESAYEESLAYELSLRKLAVKRQIDLPLRYKEIALSTGYRIDMLVEDSVVLELKAVDVTLPIHTAQLLTYMRLSRMTVGLLINFNVPVLKDGIVRRVLERSSVSAPPRLRGE